MRYWLSSGFLFALITACRPAPEPLPASILAEGISQELAQHRAKTLGDVRYDVHLSISAERETAVRGHVLLRFAWQGSPGPLVLDFAAPENVFAVRFEATGGQLEVAPYTVENNHLVVDGSVIRSGENTLRIDFAAGDGPLHRQESFLYTLFVPERAHHALPCFDQPDLKARFRLTLEMPEAWRAVANGPLVERKARRVDGETRAVWTFAETAPISTYLFAFAAGEFAIETAVRGGRTLRFLHRESDGDKVARNRERLFDLHAEALAWLEGYTSIPYPFDKLDFVLLPGFPYGGMEHPGAIFYRDSRLLLEETVTQDDLLGRASLIAHETAHMWFGDLVTMSWFDDVWLKEVFANFMAAKIVEPAFPDLPHQTRFYLAHFPAAYEIERSQGTHAIRQPLDNLREAGSLYGAIIYQKAPIVMRQLEALLGEAALRDGLRAYLDRYRFANASWLDLIALLDERAAVDLAAWSQVWVEEAGRPWIESQLTVADGRVTQMLLQQSDPIASSRQWPQRLSVLLGDDQTSSELAVELDASSVEVPRASGVEAPRYVLVGAEGLGYGRFVLDETGREALLVDLALPSSVARSVAWLTLWDELLAGRVDPGRMMELALTRLAVESETLVVERLLRDLETLYWRMLSDGERQSLQERLEKTLWLHLETGEAARKPSLLETYIAIASSSSGVATLRRLWAGELTLAGLPLSEKHLTTLACELAVRGVEDAETILDEQLSRIEQSDRRARFEFLRPALAADPETRAAFFEALRDPVQRSKEPWVLDALRYLHHPLRSATSERFLRPSLELLEEIQRTGDIFFPKRWLDATLSSHRSPTAAQTVRDFLAERPDYPARLRAKILQSADLLLRTVEHFELVEKGSKAS